MAKAQGKKAAAGPKGAVKKVAAKIKGAVASAKKKVAARPAARPAPKSAGKAAPAKAKVVARPAVKKSAPAKAMKAAKPAAKKVAKVVSKAAGKVAAKVKGKPAPKAVLKTAPKPVAPKAAVKVTSKAAAAKAAPLKAAPPAKSAVAKPSAAKLTVAAKAVPSTPRPAPAAPNAAAAPAAAKPAKRTRRPRLRLTSNGAPAASWLTSVKPRAASFIPAPPRAEAPSAIAAPPASSDRLIRPEEVMELAVRTVPVRVDIEQGAGRFYVNVNPMEVTLRPGEGIEWDFRYLGGADVNVDEVVVEFEKPAPFTQAVFRTRKPGGARPHRQLSGGVSRNAIGSRVQYTLRAMTPFKTEVASARVWLTVIA